MKRLAHLTILLLLLTSSGHSAVVCFEQMQSDVACEDGCCISGHELSPPSSPDPGEDFCCTVGSQPDAELLKLNKQTSAPMQGTLCVPLVSLSSTSPLLQSPTAPSRYLRDGSDRYLKTRALLI